MDASLTATAPKACTGGKRRGTTMRPYARRPERPLDGGGGLLRRRLAPHEPQAERRDGQWHQHEDRDDVDAREAADPEHDP